MNKQAPYRLEYKIPKEPKDIKKFLDTIVEDISKECVLTPLVANKFRFIITELCTNYIKHVNVRDGKFSIEAYDNSFIKITGHYGQHSFKPVLEEKITFDQLNNITEIFFTETNNHYIEVLANNKIRFLDPLKLGLHSESLKDHFGLHIITICSEEFCFEFDEYGESEQFTVIIKCV